MHVAAKRHTWARGLGLKMVGAWAAVRKMSVRPTRHERPCEKKKKPSAAYEVLESSRVGGTNILLGQGHHVGPVVEIRQSHFLPPGELPLYPETWYEF